MESFLNLGADEVDIRTIQRNFALVDDFEVRSFLGCHGDGKPEAAEHFPGPSSKDLRRLTSRQYTRAAGRATTNGMRSDSERQA
jgi:hypothetical protein